MTQAIYKVTNDVLFDLEKNDVLDGIVQKIEDGLFFCEWARTLDGNPQRIEDKINWYFLEGRKVVCILDFDAAMKIQDNSYITDFEEIDFDQFDEMLNILPPMRWGNFNGIESFAVSERYSGDITSFYFHTGNRYFTKMDSLKKSTLVLVNELHELLGTYKK